MTTRQHRYAKLLRPGDRLLRAVANQGSAEHLTVLTVESTTETLERQLVLVKVELADGTQINLRYSPNSTVEVERS